MDYIKKVKTLEEHINAHPADYQAVVALLKARSDMIERRLYMERIERVKKVAHYRRMLNEKPNV